MVPSGKETSLGAGAALAALQCGQDCPRSQTNCSAEVFLAAGGPNNTVGVQTSGAIEQVIDGLDHVHVGELVAGERSELEERHVIRAPMVRWEAHRKQDLA